MSRGAGRIERAITAAFATNPTMTYTVEDLATIAYPGVNRIEKKHRVVVIRAARQAATKAWWTGHKAERPGHPIIYYNLLDLRSYVIGQARVSYNFHNFTHTAISAAIDDPDSGLAGSDSWRKDMELGSPYWYHVEINRAQHAGNGELADQLMIELQKDISKRAAALGFLMRSHAG